MALPIIYNITEASLHLGFRSRSTLQRLVAKGYLDAYLRPSDGREVLLETTPAGQPSLREKVRSMTQYRPGSPLWGQERHWPVVELSDEEPRAYTDTVMEGLDAVELGPDWASVAEQLNAYLGDSWPAPPWDSGQAATVAMCLALAQEAVAGG